MGKEAPSGNYWNKLGIFAIVVGVLCVLCFFMVVLFSASSHSSPTPTTNNQVPVDNQISTISAATMTAQASSNATATPDMLSCGIIDAVLNDYLNRLTWDQYHLEEGEVDLYIKSLYGKKIRYQGKIDDVIGNVFIYDDSCQNRVSLNGIPNNESILLEKGSTISGYGTVGVFSTYQIINIDVDSYQVVK